LSETELYFTVSNAGVEATVCMIAVEFSVDRCKAGVIFLTNDVTYLKVPHFHGMNVSYLLTRLCKGDKETRTFA